MAFRLNDPSIIRYWREVSPLFTKTGKRVFRGWLLYLEQIPCEASYNYLVTIGIYCNNCEIYLNDSEYMGYINILNTLGHLSSEEASIIDSNPD